MKTLTCLLLFIGGITHFAHAQLPNTETASKNTENTENIMDLQAQTLGNIFGNIGNIDELKGVDDFMSLINKMDADPETKERLTKQYQLYSNSLDPKKKEVVKAQFNQMLLEAIKEGQEKGNRKN